MLGSPTVAVARSVRSTSPISGRRGAKNVGVKFAVPVPSGALMDTPPSPMVHGMDESIGTNDAGGRLLHRNRSVGVTSSCRFGGAVAADFVVAAAGLCDSAAAPRAAPAPLN